MRTFRQKWYAGETISVGIGQGALEVSPLQLAHAIGGLATGGVKVENVLQVIDGMHEVVNGSGTGARARIPGLDVCGKTGTSQLASNDVLRGTALGRTMKDNAWFVGFAPQQSPEIVVVALFEGGEHGNLAAPIVRDVIKSYFDKRLRKDPREMIAALPSFGPLSTARKAIPASPAAVILRMGATAEVVR
jgi:penicillin-binding protein 2